MSCAIWLFHQRESQKNGSFKKWRIWITKHMESNQLGRKANFLAQYTVRVTFIIHRMFIDLNISDLDGGDDMESVIVAAFKRYCVSNPLHPDAFPTVRKMEAEVIAMCLRLYNNPDGAGTMTCGGSESIIMAVKTYRDWARATKGITEPEMYVFVPLSDLAVCSDQRTQDNPRIRTCCI